MGWAWSPYFAVTRSMNSLDELLSTASSKAAVVPGLATGFAQAVETTLTNRRDETR